MVGIQSTGVGEKPDMRPTNDFRLKTAASLRDPEGDAERAKANNRQHPWSIAVDLLPQQARSENQLLCCHQIGPRGRPAHQVRDPKAQLEKLLVIKRAEQSRREPCCVKGRPEPVAGTGEVMASSGRVSTGVDSAEQDPQIWRDHIANPLAVRGRELLSRRMPGSAMLHV
jgi:hypothetical protein